MLFLCQPHSAFRHLLAAQRKTNKQTNKNTHLERNVVILVHRSASLQHVFGRAVSRLLVRQRRLSRGHRNAGKSCACGGSRTSVVSEMCPRKDAHGCLRAVRRSVPVSASLQPLCEHYCAWPRSAQPGASTKEDQKKKRKEKRNHTLLSRCEKTEATLESKLDKQPARQGGKQAETCSVRPGVGRW